MEPPKKSLYEEWKKRHEEEVQEYIEIGEMVKGAPLTESEKKTVRSRAGSKLDPYNVCVIAPYLVNETNLINLMQTTKKFRDLNERMKENPIDINTKKGMKLFEDINTLRIHDPMKYKMFETMMKEAVRKNQLKDAQLTEEDMRIFDSIKVEGMMTEEEERNRKILRLRNMDTEESRALVRKLEIPQGRFEERYSMYDIGEVVAPHFKKLVNVKIEIDPEKEVINDFLSANDERIQITRRIRREAEQLKQQGGEVLVIPGHWKRIPDNAFQNCNFREIIISPGVMVIKGSFVDSHLLREVTIPASVMVIGTYAFCRCENLRQIHFSPRGRKDKLKLEQFCFLGIGIQEMILPPTCQIIESEVLKDCFNLQRIRLPEELEQLGWLMVQNCFELRLIELPQRFAKDRNELLGFLGVRQEIKDLIQIQYY